MNVFARVDGGVVRKLFTPPGDLGINDCFHGALTWVDVTAVTPAPQVGWTATETNGSWSFATPVAPVLTLAQQAALLLTAGLTIASTGTPAIDGVYGCDTETRATIAEVTAGINAGHGLPGGGSTFDFNLRNGTGVTFPATAVFLAAAVAIRDFVYGCSQVVNGRSGTLPSASVTIV